MSTCPCSSAPFPGSNLPEGGLMIDESEETHLLWTAIEEVLQLVERMNALELTDSSTVVVDEAEAETRARIKRDIAANVQTPPRLPPAVDWDRKPPAAATPAAGAAGGSMPVALGLVTPGKAPPAAPAAADEGPAASSGMPSAPPNSERAPSADSTGTPSEPALPRSHSAVSAPFPVLVVPQDPAPLQAAQADLSRQQRQWVMGLKVELRRRRRLNGDGVVEDATAAGTDGGDDGGGAEQRGIAVPLPSSAARDAAGPNGEVHCTPSPLSSPSSAAAAESSSVTLARLSSPGPLSPARRQRSATRVTAAAAAAASAAAAGADADPRAADAAAPAPSDPEAALPFDQLEIEDAAECLETLSSHLEEVEREIRRALERYARLQVQEAETLARDVAEHRDRLVVSTERAKARVAALKDLIDSLSHKTSKAKRTLSAAKDLHVGDSARLRENLNHVRTERGQALLELEFVLGARNSLQSQLARFELLLAHLTCDLRRRSYAVLLDEVASADFQGAMGPEYQSAAIALVERMAAHSAAHARGERKLVDVARARAGVRASLALVVAQYWR